MILVVAAMKEEIKEIIQNELPTVKVILTGIGKVNAAQSLAEAIAKYHVDAIYNLGFAGATYPYQVGDVVLIEEACYHDFDLTLFGYQKGQVPGCPATFLSDESLKNWIKLKLPNIKTGKLFTGDYFMTEVKNESYLADMEGAALFQVANKKQIPMVSIKIISDVIGMDNHYQEYKKFESSVGAIVLKDIFLKLFLEV
jgi:adenosylhomocysteine nucleosidase